MTVINYFGTLLVQNTQNSTISLNLDQYLGQTITIKLNIFNDYNYNGSNTKYYSQVDQSIDISVGNQPNNPTNLHKEIQ